MLGNFAAHPGRNALFPAIVQWIHWRGNPLKQRIEAHHDISSPQRPASWTVAHR
jgi:hypothetical protein